MPITKEVSHDCLVAEDGQLQVREITRLMENGVEVAKSYRRYVKDVGDDVSAEPKIIKDIAGGVHTVARVNARAVEKAAAQAPI